jgi:hypothetical protein
LTKQVQKELAQETREDMPKDVASPTRSFTAAKICHKQFDHLYRIPEKETRSYPAFHETFIPLRDFIDWSYESLKSIFLSLRNHPARVADMPVRQTLLIVDAMDEPNSGL